MLNKYLSGIVSILLLVFMICDIYMYRKPHLNLVSCGLFYSINALDFCGEFGNNKTLGNQNFVGKIFEVSGIIIDFQIADSTANLRLYAEKSETFINCKFQTVRYKKLGIPPKGALVTIKGKFTCFHPDISLADCEIEQHSLLYPNW